MLQVRSPAFRRKFVSGLHEDADSMKDFFISYTSADRHWAEWIAWQLEEAKYSVDIQVWDFGTSKNFVAEMDRASKEAERTLAVLTPKYFESRFTLDEWTVAFLKGNFPT